MKIKSEHYTYMLEQIQLISNKMQTRNEYNKAGLSDRRYRWDLCYAARLTPWICANVYSYANDDHIDTVLRKIVKELNL